MWWENLGWNLFKAHLRFCWQLLSKLFQFFWWGQIVILSSQYSNWNLNIWNNELQHLRQHAICNKYLVWASKVGDLLSMWYSVIELGCNRTTFWRSVELANFIATVPVTHASKLDVSSWSTVGLQCKKYFQRIQALSSLPKSKLNANHLPPQQNPPAPMAETPLLFRAAITALASSYPLS